MRYRHYLINILMSLAGFATLLSCEEEEHPWAAYRKDLAEAWTNADGAISYLVLDNGDTLHITNPPYGLEADTVYRYMATYVVQEEQSSLIRLTGLSPILTLIPFTTDDPQIPSDYVTPISIWRGGNYLNLTLNILTRGKGHKFGLVHYGLIEQSDGSRLLQTILYHDANQDHESYTRTVYLSCRLHEFQPYLQTGRDSISITLNSREEGLITRTIPY